MLGIKRTLASTALIVLVAVPCLAATIEEVEKDLVAAIKKTKSMKGNMKSDIHVTFQGYEMSSVSEATIEALRDGETFKMRTEGTAKSSQKMGGNETKNEQKMMTISDGEYSYSLMSRR